MVHVAEIKPKGWEGNGSSLSEISLDERKRPDLLLGEPMENEAKIALDKGVEMEDQRVDTNSTIERISVEGKGVENISSFKRMPGMGDNMVESTSDIERIETMEDKGVETISNTEEMERLNNKKVKELVGNVHAETCPGTHWDVFRRQDVPKLIEYLQRHFEDFGWSDGANNFVSIAYVIYESSIYLVAMHFTYLRMVHSFPNA